MRQELIVDALNLLEDDILEETDKLRKHGSTAHGSTAAVRWRRMGAGIAACFVLACSGWLFYRYGNQEIVNDPFVSEAPPDISGTDIPNVSEETLPSDGAEDGLPLLSAMDFSAMGTGFGGEMAYDVSELISGNPWSETDSISTLPVYRNPINIDESAGFMVTGMNVAKMWEVLQETVDRLGLDNDSLEMTGPSVDLNPAEPVAVEAAVVSAKGDGIELEVNASLTVEIIFDPPATLPDSYNNYYYASYEEKAALGQYLQDVYRNLIGWDEPTLVIAGGGYDIYANQSYRVEFFNGKGDLTEKILNFNFDRIVFYGNSYENQLDRIRIFQSDRSQKLGDYPVITVEKARDLLLEGKYVSSVPYEVPGEEYVASVELVYSTGEMDEYFMPYYRFYVELPEERDVNQEAQERELLTYGIYYVPAVEEKYLDGKPLWHFNF